MRDWLKKWIKFWSIPLIEKFAFLESYTILTIIFIGLKILPFSIFKKYYKALFYLNQSGQLNSKYQNFKVQSVIRAANAFPFEITCLPRALALKFLLRGSDLISLRIGVQKKTCNEQFEAHAWLEDKNGKILIGNVPNFSYLPLWEWN